MSPSATANEAISALPIVWRDDNDGGGEAQHQDGHAKPPGPPSQEFLDAAWAHQFNHRRAVTTRVPRAVVHATHPSHVAGAVKLAKALGVRVSVRSGGHSWACWGVRDDAVLVDLGALPGGKFVAPASGEQGQGQGQDGQGKEGLVYDDRTKVVGAPPSATGRLLNAFLATRGRLFAGGHCPDVGLGGFLLQGGMGWNCKNWGWACESVVGIDVVTAAGEERYCSQSENADLFWAARGAGPGTSFRGFFSLPRHCSSKGTNQKRLRRSRLPGDRDTLLSHDAAVAQVFRERLHVSTYSLSSGFTMGHRCKIVAPSLFLLLSSIAAAAPAICMQREHIR